MWRLRCGRSGGFTFAELLLVLTILLVVSGLVFPPVLRMMADQPLKDAVERTRAQLANVRLRALDSSSPWQFRFEPGGQRYLWMPQELLSRTGAGGSSGTSGSRSMAVPPNTGPGIQSGTLPKGMYFLSEANGEALTVERLPSELLSGLPDGYQLAQTGWSAPITFQPDGSTTDAQLVIVNARGRQMRLTIRGFTGGITVFPIEDRSRR